MRRALLACSLAAVTFAPLHAGSDPWPGVAKRAASAIVSVKTDDGSCSGSVIDVARKYVLTAEHCAGTNIFADRVAATIVSKDSDEDLMILKVPELDPARTALTLAARNPEIQVQVLSCGFGYALKRPFWRSARITDTEIVVPGLTSTFIGTDAPFIGGMSGGPVLDVAGNIVAIVQRGDGGALGIGVGAETIRDRMGRFFAQAVKP